ncbi:PQQ-binding-like beta-propeller repeat protein [Streptomyces cyaneofuscatus]|uniref:PQQ-binding-like beta-propeller repeat protein n=1 Tax=Streptomyces cyaneofuscatus TaxID=66883 RepID=A0ABZ1EYY5_9ACTN|nr:PQQ-binding-like beta-propeller repeat protein [Streptomyces cyaneofuscatus]WSB09369.1 PQQ-binding-like beta-propeller repeat protein [Streptomyces cyaneofuscatus]WSD47095.1 PQQ-binding-like beta-propeller repeat protein [Streptomyces cyaneofuscatus]WTA90497.1 PQQ-binding-like beta-propeller repeat protein [Streptomyces cyaneofuscatus]
MSKGSTGYGTTAGKSSRRRILRLAGAGLTMVALGAGLTGCEDTSETGGEGSIPPPRTASPEDGGKAPEDGQAPAPLWTKSTSAATYGDNDELVAVGGVVIASGDPLAALDGASGEERWSLPGGAIPGAPLLLGKGTLYLASGKYDGSVIGYDPASGKETWRSHLGKEYRQPRPVAVDDQQVYVIAEILEPDNSSRTNVIAALNSSTGKLVWKEQRDLGTQQNGVHAAVQGRYLVYTDFKKNLTVRDTATGRQVWTQKTTKTSYGPFAVHQDLVIVPQGQKLQAFTLADGSEKWSVEAERFTTFREPTVLDDVLYIADSGRTLWALDPRTGEKVWQSTALKDAGAQVPRQFVRVGSTLYGATDLDKQGGIHAFDAKNGALRWTFNDASGDYHAWLVATDGKHVFALHGKKLHALHAA